MVDLSKRTAIRNVIGASIVAATSISLFGNSVFASGRAKTNSSRVKTKRYKFNRTTSKKRWVRYGTVRTRSGERIKINRRKSGTYLSVIRNGRIIRRRPTGRIVLQDGKTVIVNKGKIIGGNSFSNGKFAAFALLRR